MTERAIHVLYLCTGNSARSILAEAITNRLGADRFRAFSAGSQPKGKVNPAALALLAARGCDTSALRSKSWTEFAEAGAPAMDFIITVCDSAAEEACPIWPGHPAAAHWGIPDPAAVLGDDDIVRAAFEMAYKQLEERIKLFIELPLDRLDGKALKQRLAEIGSRPGATAMAREQAA